jgi:hypothetical protein
MGGIDGGTETSLQETSTASWEGLSRVRCAAGVHPFGLLRRAQERCVAPVAHNRACSDQGGSRNGTGAPLQSSQRLVGPRMVGTLVGVRLRQSAKGL